MYLASWALARPPVGSKIKEPHTFAYPACLQESGICGLSVYAEGLQRRGCCYFQGDIVSVSAAALLSKARWISGVRDSKGTNSIWGPTSIEPLSAFLFWGICVFFFCKAAD